MVFYKIENTLIRFQLSLVSLVQHGVIQGTVVSSVCQRIIQTLHQRQSSSMNALMFKADNEISNKTNKASLVGDSPENQIASKDIDQKKGSGLASHTDEVTIVATIITAVVAAHLDFNRRMKPIEPLKPVQLDCVNDESRGHFIAVLGSVFY